MSGVDSIDPTAMYHCCEVSSWKDVNRICNLMAYRGFRLHTIRDGLRGSGLDMGYRLVFERLQ